MTKNDDPMIIEQSLPQDDDTVHLRYRIGQDEMEVEGPAAYADKHAALFLTAKLGAGQAQQLNFLGLVDGNSNDVQLLADDSAPQTIDDNEHKSTEQPQPAPDIVSFFVEKAPKNQREQILVITYYCQHYKDYERVSLDDYEAAYETLKRVPVKKPARLQSTVKSAVERSDYLWIPETGDFALTLEGELLVKDMGVDV